VILLRARYKCNNNKNTFRQNIPRQQAQRSILVPALNRQGTNFIIIRPCPSLVIGGYTLTRLLKSGKDEVKESGECLLMTKEATSQNAKV